MSTLNIQELNTIKEAAINAAIRGDLLKFDSLMRLYIYRRWQLS